MAPNSPKLIAKEKIPPTIIPLFISGNSIFLKTITLEAPNDEATFNNSTSIRLYATKIDLVTNGMLIRT